MRADYTWSRRDRAGLGSAHGTSEASWSVVGVADQVDVRLVDDEGRTLWLSMPREEAARLGARLTRVALSDFDVWRDNVRRELDSMVGVGGELLSGIPDAALRLRFDRGDDPETVACVIVEENKEGAV